MSTHQLCRANCGGTDCHKPRIYYLPTEAAMHTNEWPARRCAGPCDQGRKLCVTPEACEVPCDTETVSPLIGILVGSVLGALMICGAVWLWRSLL